MGDEAGRGVPGVPGERAPGVPGVPGDRAPGAPGVPGVPDGRLPGVPDERAPGAGAGAGGASEPGGRVDAVRAVGAVVLDEAGRILLVQRRDPPQAGRWTLPGGKVEPGEAPREAVAREVCEETGLTVEVRDELGMLHSPTADGRVFEIRDFAARPLTEPSAARAADDAAALRWVPLESLPGLEAAEGLELTDGLVGWLRGFGVLP